MKNVKRLGIGIGIVIILVLSFSGWYSLKMKAIFGEMTPVTTQELVDGVFAIQDTFSNMYLLKNGQNYVAIDAANQIENVKTEMNKLGIDPDEVNAVFLTHTDGDHVGAIKLFKKATVYISAAEEQMIDGRTSRAAFFMKNRLDSDYRMLKDGEIIEFPNLQVKGALTPGHTPGSMVYIINGKYLFTGDTLSLKDQKAYLSSAFFNMDSVTEGKSIQRLARLTGIEALFTAHYGYATDFKSALASWKE